MIKRSTKPIARSPLKKKKRPASKTERIYGPPARRVFVKGRPCAACGVEGFTVQAHVAPASEKGTGYKADAKWIVPFCCTRENDWSVVMGCHEMYDEHYEMFSELYPDFNPEAVAAETQRLWILFSGGSPTTGNSND